MAAKQATKKSGKGWYLSAEGLAFVFLGAVAIIMPYIYQINMPALIGWLFIGAGGFKILRSCCGGASLCGTGLRLLSAIVYLGAGIWIVVDHSMDLTTLYIILCAVFGIHALASFVWAYYWRGESRWALPLFNGLISAAAAGVIWAGYPQMLGWFLGLLVGVHLAVYGLVRIACSCRGCCHTK